MRRVLGASLTAVAVLLVLALSSIPAGAQGTITFDDLAVPNATYQPISNGYQGLNWSNFYVFNTNGLIPSGYVNGVVSPSNVAFNGFGAAAAISDSTFSFDSAYFTAAWNDGLTITINGLFNGTLMDTTSFTVNTSGPILETFNWVGINELDFSSAGGTNHGYSGGGTQFAMDNLTITPVPEPNSLVLLGMGMLGFAVLLSHKKLLG